MVAPAHEPSDGDLVRRTRQGDTEAYGELVRRYQASVFNVCFRLLGERAAAEDLAQEAFVRAYERLDRYDAGRPLGPWLRRLAANLCLNHLERTRAPEVPLDDEADAPVDAVDWASQDPARLAEAAQSAQALRAAILRLPARYRAVIELRHFQELSYAEIAAALDRPMSDVKSDLFRARKLLAAALTRSEIDHE
jgi:RNA polymerase sigma-70 factor (ECF subfamily)